MTRDELQAAAALRLKQDKRLICQWATGSGKSRVALNFIKEHPGSTLILVPERDNISNWIAEFDKFGVSTMGVEIACYASVHKYEGTSWNLLVLDESPHADTDLKEMFLSTIKAEYVLALGAYLRDEEKDTLRRIYGDFTIWTINLKAAINAGFIPTPSVRVIHMNLDNRDRKYMSRYGKSTALEAYGYIDKQVKDAVAAYNSHPTEWAKIVMQRLGSERKRVLGQLKEDAVARVCEALRQKNKRFLCFCSTIDSAKKLGGDLAYTSQTPKSQKILERFNNHEIDQLYVVGKLIEGQNLNDIECGILGSIGNSNRITIQSIGRIMRSDNPIIYVPVIDNTKDESFLYTVTNNVPKEYIKHYKL
jgi:superfamily II DNA or RNA helicase